MRSVSKDFLPLIERKSSAAHQYQPGRNSHSPPLRLLLLPPQVFLHPPVVIDMQLKIATPEHRVLTQPPIRLQRLQGYFGLEIHRMSDGVLDVNGLVFGFLLVESVDGGLLR